MVSSGWLCVPGLESLPLVATNSVPVGTGVVGGGVVGGGVGTGGVVGAVPLSTMTSSKLAVALKVATPIPPEAYWVSVACRRVPPLTVLRRVVPVTSRRNVYHVLSVNVIGALASVVAVPLTSFF